MFYHKKRVTRYVHKYLSQELSQEKELSQENGIESKDDDGSDMDKRIWIKPDKSPGFERSTSLDRFGMNKIFFMTLFIIQRSSLLEFLINIFGPAFGFRY